MTNWFLDFKVNGLRTDSFTGQRRFSSGVQNLNFRYKFCMIQKNFDFKLQNFCLWLYNSLESKFLAFLYQWYMQRDITCFFILEENLQYSGQTKITFVLYQQQSSLNMYRIIYYNTSIMKQSPKDFTNHVQRTIQKNKTKKIPKPHWGFSDWVYAFF